METTVTAEAGSSDREAVTIHVVSHTHWDREWYLPMARFRQQLVGLVDDLLDDPPTGGSSFLLDGQMVVIEDYLAIRPERHNALATLLSSGALEAGPWYVLADELIPGGEALVRNLLAGRRILARFGASAPPVLYCPDSFGHPAAMPTLATGFGLGLVILSRGFGGERAPRADAVVWKAPSGESAVLYHLSKKGYDIGENLPFDEAAARARWAELRGDLLSRSKLGVALLPNGADHHARQRHLGEALQALTAASTPHAAKGSSLGAFASEALARARAANLETVSGELRDSYGYMWTLQGTFATRAHQKRRNAQAERLLTRDAEPWAALARRRGAPSRAPLVNAAWQSLLLCHPHDTLCGCSTDEVARAMDARLDEAHSQGEGIRDDALLDLIGHDPDSARTKRSEWKPMAVVRNAAARPRGGVALIRLASFVSDVKVGANASPGPVETAPPSTPALGGVGALQVLSRSLQHERTEAPRHYPDNDLVQVSEVAAWIPEVPAYGLRAFPHQSRAKKHEVPNAAWSEAGTISNGLIRVRIEDGGAIALTDHRSGRTISDALIWESETDLGDLYTQSLRGPRLAVKFRGSKITARGPLRASMETRWQLGGGSERVDATVTFIVDANAPFVRVQVRGVNAASDHRLRLGFRADIDKPRVLADAMFGPVERRDIEVSAADAAFERPPRTAPLHRYVSLFGANRGATVFSDGLGEYEATPGGVLFVTLVRSVSELSRNDMPERPGHAGWPTHTPEAQCHGPFAADLALMLHDDDSMETRDLIERTADDVLLPLTGRSLRSALELPDSVEGVLLEGLGLACSAIKESENHDWLVLRCVNVTEAPQDGAWLVGAAVSEARLGRLDETPLGTLAASGNRIAFSAPPRAVVTILVRIGSGGSDSSG
jgi:mannosylglycerate hydrolase